MPNYIFELINLGKQYPKNHEWALRNVDLAIQQGEIFGLLGENGAGKSTLVKQLVGLLKPTEGRILFQGKDIINHPLQVALNIGYMPQKATSLNLMTVNESIYYTAHLRGLSRHDARLEVDRLLKIWRIEEIKNKNNRQLSGGQQRLLRLAVAMAGRLPVLILDEPTNDLDPMRRKLAWDNLRQLNKQDGTTIIFITHDALEAEKIIQRVGIMRDGGLIAVGNPKELKKNVDQALRLDLFFEPGHPPCVPDTLRPVFDQNGHRRYMVDWDTVPAIMTQLNLDEIDDLRLNSASLEDLYLHYTINPAAGEEVQHAE